MLTAQLDCEIEYWKKVLIRIVAIVKSLTSRGHVIRGHDELLGSNKNGNFLMTVELVAEFDPSLGAHLKNYSNQKTNYLSSTIYEEFIIIMGNIVEEVI